MHRLTIEQTPGLRPGDEVHVSGLYTVTHDPAHAGVHEVICIKGKIFPRPANPIVPFTSLTVRRKKR
jgi:hypothetical protein